MPSSVTQTTKKTDFSIFFCYRNMTGAEGLEPSARGFGDHCSTIWAIPLSELFSGFSSFPVNYYSIAYFFWFVKRFFKIFSNFLKKFRKSYFYHNFHKFLIFWRILDCILEIQNTGYWRKIYLCTLNQIFLKIKKEKPFTDSSFFHNILSERKINYHLCHLLYK